MSETTTPLICVRREYRCDECGTGYMVTTGAMLACSPPLYPHVCDSCGAHQNMRKRYPTVDFVDFVEGARDA